ncbi:MAG: dicarboxylate/amino acid:cation symporter [Gemmatimonadota bacterium]
MAKKISLGTRTFIGLVAGVALGSIAAGFDIAPLRTAALWIEPIGTLWVNAIRMTVVPLMVAMIIRGIASRDDTRSTGRLSARTLLLFVVMIAATTTFGAVVGSILLDIGPSLGDAAANTAAGTRPELPPFRDWLVGLIPTNPVKAAADGAILPLAVFSIIFGLAATRIATDLRKQLMQVLGAVVEALFAVVEWVLALAPIGVFALSLSLVVKTGTAAAGMFGYYILIACVLCSVSAIALYPIVAAVARVPIRAFARALATAQAVAFTSRSSLASLPAMMKGAETLGIPESITGLVLPLGVSVFKYASPIVRVVGTLFVARLYGHSLSLSEVTTIAAAIGVLSFYSPGIPSGGLLIIAPLYESLGLPLQGIGLLIALDTIPDMFLTTANVTGDMAVAVMVAAAEPAGAGEIADGETTITATADS